MNEETISETIRKEIENWKKNTRKKGTFYLYKKEDYERYGETGYWYHVIWYEKKTNKTKIGLFHDHMMTRYGVVTLATLIGTSATGLWQASNDTIGDDELAAMIKVAKGETEGFEIFDVDQIKGLRT